MGSGQLGRLGRTMSAGAQQQLLQQRLGAAPRISHSGPLVAGQVCPAVLMHCLRHSLVRPVLLHSHHVQLSSAAGGAATEAQAAAAAAMLLPEQHALPHVRTCAGPQVPGRGMPGAFRASAGSLQGLPLGRGRPEVMGRPGRRSGEGGPDAERKAQQERMYMLDYNKVMAGGGCRFER